MSAFYEWLKIGEGADAKQANGEQLTQRERQCRDLFLAVTRARTEYGEDLRRFVLDVAAHHRRRKTTLSRREVFDPHGEKVWLEAEEFEQIDKPDLRALMVIRESWERASALADRALEDQHADEFVRVGEIERRLAAQLSKRTVHICDDDEKAAFTLPVSAQAHDDDDYDMYGLWPQPIPGFTTSVEEVEPGKVESQGADSV
jgi:hypothetical protein